MPTIIAYSHVRFSGAARAEGHPGRPDLLSAARLAP